MIDHPVATSMFPSGSSTRTLPPYGAMLGQVTVAGFELIAGEQVFTMPPNVSMDAGVSASVAVIVIVNGPDVPMLHPGAGSHDTMLITGASPPPPGASAAPPPSSPQE